MRSVADRPCSAIALADQRMNPPASDLYAQATSLTLDLVERHRNGRVVGARDGRVGMKLPLLLRDSRAVPLLDAGARRIEAILGPDVEALVAVRDCYLPEPGVSHSAAGQCAAASTVVITIAAATAPNALAGLRPTLFFAPPVVLSLFLFSYYGVSKPVVQMTVT